MSQTEEIQCFFAEYQDALSACDTAHICRLYIEPFQISNPDFLVNFPSLRQAALHMDGLFEKYRSHGFGKAVIKTLTIREYESGHAIADLTWKLETPAGDEIISFDTTYIVRRYQGSWKIVFVIAHNENEHFKAIAQPSP
ncbi:MAG: nuclear transport factor 2 family protein [Leptolyngbyaceae cyanobacterium HOT.MB2.61]|jgi:ketosteroid isomerase-like protein|nr:nuclear transport factor 2 family protein [Leptolyngbyaceae cyanobacterium HOT.MB2.61]